MLNSTNPLLLTKEQSSAIELATHREGWFFVSNGGTEGGYHIERDAEMGTFLSDDEAIKFVERLATNGSTLHQMALTHHQQTESLNSAPLDLTGLLPLDELTIADIDAAAQSEGWLFGTILADGADRFKINGAEQFMISKLDESTVFASDDEAYLFVRRKATAGSLHHKLAIAAHGQSHSVVTGLTRVKAKLEIEIDYLLPPEMNQADIEQLLKDNASQFIGSGGITGDTEATTESYEVKVNTFA